MLKGFLMLLIFGFLFIVIIALVVLRFLSKGFRSMREVQEEILNSGGKRYSRSEYVRHQREQKEKNPFGNDYFKSSDNAKNGKRQEEKKQKTTRRTTTSSGVTIIDDREKEDKRKIFDHGDGEYVEFEEI